VLECIVDVRADLFRRREPPAGIVLRGDTVIDLTPKLLDLLPHLVDHPGELVTKKRPSRRCGVPQTSSTTHSHRQYRSCDKPGRRCRDIQIHKTVARRGYRFAAAVSVVIGDAAPSLLVSSAQSIAVLDFKNITGDAGRTCRGRALPAGIEAAEH
jgi:hypothetical protein